MLLNFNIKQFPNGQFLMDEFLEETHSIGNIHTKNANCRINNVGLMLGQCIHIWPTLNLRLMVVFCFPGDLP